MALHEGLLVTRHFLDVDDLSEEELEEVLALSAVAPVVLGSVLAGRGAALVFEKPSARTRSSTELAVTALGGHPVYIQGGEVGFDSRETVEDVARTLACYHSVLCARVFQHGTLRRMTAALDAQGASVPVVNLLSDIAHPCQALADLLTMQELFGRLEGLTVAYVGDANNMWSSLSKACVMSGVEIRLAAPSEYQPPPSQVDALLERGGKVTVTSDPESAVSGADVIYTDVWTSMGQEEEAQARRKAFAGYTVDDALVAKAPDKAVVLHCLPAHRGEEISASVLDGPRSQVWKDAENRLHAMRGLLAFLLGVRSPVE